MNNTNKNAGGISPALIFFSIAITSILLIAGFAIFLAKPAPRANTTVRNESNTDLQIIEKDGKQIVNITAKNGFNPSELALKSGIPTTLNVRTKNTYDCSSQIIIPALKVSKSLPISGETPIEIPAQMSGAKITASCGMGHYPLTLSFL